jgi:hypothetical protein
MKQLLTALPAKVRRLASSVGRAWRRVRHPLGRRRSPAGGVPPRQDEDAMSPSFADTEAVWRAW